MAATPAIAGTFTVCVGATTALTDTAAGTWSSGSTGVATVGSTTGIVTGVSGGTARITFTAGTGAVTQVVTVNPAPVVPAITGINDICLGSGTTLFDATAGGVWSSGTPAVATVSSVGAVSSVSAGSTRITYAVTNVCGTTRVTRTVAVDTLLLHWLCRGQ